MANREGDVADMRIGGVSRPPGIGASLNLAVSFGRM